MFSSILGSDKQLFVYSIIEVKTFSYALFDAILEVYIKEINLIGTYIFTSRNTMHERDNLLIFVSFLRFSKTKLGTCFSQKCQSEHKFSIP